MKSLPPLRPPHWIASLAVGTLLSACGGSGGEPAPDKAAAAVQPSGQTQVLAENTVSSAASAASAPALPITEPAPPEPAASAASTAASNLASVRVPQAAAASAAPLGQAAVKPGTKPEPSAPRAAAPVAESLPGAVAAAPPAAAASNVEPSTAAVATEAPRARIQAAAPAPARCTVNETRSFGACKAYASIGISHGERVSFWNTNANVSGSIAASCNNGVVSWEAGACSDTTPVLNTVAKTGSVSQASATTVTQLSSPPPPSLGSMQTFVATPPYSVLSISGPKAVPLIPYGGKQEVPRTHDFVGAFVNPANQRPNAVTVQTPIVAGGTLQYMNLHEASAPPLTAIGSPGRAALEGGALKLAYFANDPASSEKLRTQVNSYAIPIHRTLAWDLSLKFGGDLPGEAWPTVKYTSSPVLIWQVIQNLRGFPPLVLLVDTDPSDTNKLMLILAWRGSNAAEYTNRWTVAGLAKGQYHDLVIQANLDERENQAGGQGKLRMWVNGKLAADLSQRTLYPDVDDTYRWAIAVYQTNQSTPIPLTRVVKWRRARMLVNM